jgi:hypothetical protein
MKKNGKVKGRVGCNTEETGRYIVNEWLKNTEKKGICIVYNTETKKEHVWTK